MTVPDDPVQAVHESIDLDVYRSEVAGVLDAVPDGWAKIDGEWQKLTPLIVQLVRGNATEANP